jgi:hypothetical protein
MSDKDKLDEIAKMIDAWMEQPDPELGADEGIEAADVLCAIQKVVEL